MSKKINLTVLIITTAVLSCTAIAKSNDDYLQSDMDKLLKGEKCLIGAKLEGANLKGMKLNGVNFRNAELEKVNFENADLTNTNFTNADLEEANLKGAKINGAIFSGTELEYAKWTDGRICAEGSIGGCW